VTYLGILEVLANLAAILTAAVATVAFGQYKSGQSKRRKLLENHLRDEKLSGIDDGRRTVIHLMAYLSMTEAEVLQAGFSSKLVRSVPGTDDQGRAVRLYFEYDDDELQIRQLRRGRARA